MRKIDIWELKETDHVETIYLTNDDPGDEYICIRDDLDELIMVPKHRWSDFIKACQKLEVEGV